MPSDQDSGGFFRNMLKPGTVACALISGLLGVAVAISFLNIGFWKTALIVLCFVIGWVIGRSKRLREFVSDLINRIFGRQL